MYVCVYIYIYIYTSCDSDAAEDLEEVLAASSHNFTSRILIFTRLHYLLSSLFKHIYIYI